MTLEDESNQKSFWAWMDYDCRIKSQFQDVDLETQYDQLRSINKQLLILLPWVSTSLLRNDFDNPKSCKGGRWVTNFT